LIIVLIALATYASAATKSVYVCSQDAACSGLRRYQLPHANVFVKAADECDCKQISFPADSNVFIIRANPERAGTVLSQLALKGVALSIVPADNDFYFVAVLGDNLDTFEQIATKVERQKINFLAKRAKKQASNTLNLADRQMIVNAEKDDVLNSLSVSEYTTIIRQLSGAQSFSTSSGTYTIQTRHSSTVQNEYAAEFILEYLEALGYDAYYQYFRCQSGYDTQNIIGVKQGSTRPNEIVVVGGHMDSTSGNTNNAPGAVDNGSGTDGMMLIAKAFQNISLARTVHFMGFGCEEQGLIGSEYYCENSDDNIVAAITMDMIGYSNDYYGVMIEGLPTPEIQNLMSLMEDNCELYSPELTTTTRNFSFGSDHVSFQNCGIPAYLAIEQDETEYNCYHSTCDTSANINSDMGTDIARACAGVLYDIAKEI